MRAYLPYACTWHPKSVAGGTGWPGLDQNGKPWGRAPRRLDMPGRRLSQECSGRVATRRRALNALCLQRCYNYFMTALTIRDVSDDAVRTMKIRAAQAGQSLQAYLRSLIEKEAARPTVAEAVERARREATASISTADILSAIDEGRARR